MAKKLENIDAAIKDLEAQRLEIRGKQIWRCPRCKKGTQLRKLHLKIMQYYIEPYSCTGGDYWTAGLIPEYNIDCPKCHETIRELNDDWGIFSKKRWKLIHKNKDVFGSKGYECKTK